MTYVEFCLTIRVVCRVCGLSVIGWGRTVNRNAEKGGRPNSWHLDFMAVDVLADVPKVKQRCADLCEWMGLDFVDEGTHWHIEPAGPRVSPPA